MPQTKSEIPQLTGYTCTLCRQHYPYQEEMLTCPQCGETGILDIDYDYDLIGRSLNRDSLRRDQDRSMWRYKALLPLEDRDYSDFLRIGWTPLYRSLRQVDEIGIKGLYLKDDGLNPTASLKDRASGVAVAKALELGYDTISCSSTGNAASSCAGNAARAGLKTVIFVPERAPQGKLAQMLIFGARVVSVLGDYRETFNLSKAAIAKYGWYNRNAGINPVMAEGKKTVSLEIAEQLDFQPTDWVAVSVGDGCTIGGVYLGFRDLYQLGMIDRIPRILGVQSTGCSPFVEDERDCEKQKPSQDNKLADKISVGVPRNPVKALRAGSASGGAWIAVPDQAILEAMRDMGAKEGVFGEPAGVTSYAGVRQAVAQGIIQRHETVTCICSGSGLKDVANALKAAGNSIRSRPDLEELERTGLFA